MSKYFFKSNMASSKFSKSAAENIQPIFYGSTTRSIIDNWHLSKYASRNEVVEEAPENKLSKSQKRRQNRRMKALMRKGKMTGAL